MKLSLPPDWAFLFRTGHSRRRKLGHARPRIVAESVETRCLLSATTPIAQIAWAEDCIVDHNADPAIYESEFTFENAIPPGDYAFDLTFDDTAFGETIPEWDTSSSWSETDFWLDDYEEIRDSFQAAIDGTFNGFIDSFWYEDGQTTEYIGDVIYLTLESASGMLLPVEVFVSGGTAETVLASGTEILQQVEQLLVAPENNLFDTSGNLQAFDVSVNLFQFNDGSSDQLVIDSYEIFREDLSSPGFFESEFVIVDDFSFGTEAIVQDPFFETVTGDDLFVLVDFPVGEEAVEATPGDLETALDETSSPATESADVVVEATVELQEILEIVESTIELAEAPEPDLATESLSETARSRSIEVSPRDSAVVRIKRDLPEGQDVAKSSHSAKSVRSKELVAERTTDTRSAKQSSIVNAQARPVNRWQQLRQVAALAVRRIASADPVNRLPAFHQTGVTPASTGSISLGWSATIAAFTQSALNEQLQGLTAAESGSGLTEEGSQMTYAQAASAAGTIAIGATATFQVLHKRRKAKRNRRQATVDVIAGRDTLHNFSTAAPNQKWLT